MVKIGNTDYTKNTLLPIKWSRKTDGSLNSGILTIANIERKEVFEPMTIIEVDFDDWVISYDSVEETIIGKNKRYTHTISFIETSKEAERYIVDTCTFTNSIVKTQRIVYLDGIVTNTEYSDYITIVAKKYDSPKKENAGDYLYVDSFNEVIKATSGTTLTDKKLTVKKSDGTIWFTTEGEIGYVTRLVRGDYTISYSMTINGTHTSTVKFYIKVTQNGTQDITITDVINRVLTITETLTEDETPRFAFNSEQAEEYSYVLAPEFTFTKKTLREAMVEIGQYIHRKPVLIGNEWRFIETAKTAKAGLPKNYISYQGSQDIENYCSEVDSQVENLINLDDEQNGVIVDPCINGWKTTRAETGNVRVDDETAKIVLQENAEKIIKLEMGFIGVGSSDTLVGDITPYLYEQTEYNALSSYEERYPNSKALALCYKKGSNEITGFTFEVPNAVSQAFSHRAITNIVNDVLGTNYSDFVIGNLNELQFRVTYIPIIRGRVKQVKDNLKALDKKSTLIYNANSNQVDTDYYGEHLKEVVARLGNKEEKYTYIVKSRWKIPEAGDLFDDNKWISSVDVEEYNDYYKFTIGVSKDFVKRNEYLGIDNGFRLSEISTEQVYDRWVAYEDMCIVYADGDDIHLTDYQEPLVDTRMLKAITQNFIDVGSTEWSDPCVSYMILRTYNEYDEPLSRAMMIPAISYSMGNSAVYSINCKNNFGSADTITGSYDDIFYQEEAQYCDTLGKVEKIEILGKYQEDYIADSKTEAINQGKQFPLLSGYGSNSLFKTQNKIIIKKDNREVLHFAYMIHCVSANDNIIIGSGLPKKFGLHNNTYATRESCDLYILDRKITKLDKEMANDVEGLTPVQYTIDRYDAEGYFLVLESSSVTTNGKSAVFVDHKTKELVIGQNRDITIGDSITINLAFKRYKKQEGV